jgi:hypothetical protein
MPRLREKVRAERRIPRYNPLPISLQKSRGKIRLKNRDRVRVYGHCTTKTGKLKRFGFAVLLSKYSDKEKYTIIRKICTMIIRDKSIPYGKRGTIFTPKQLLRDTPWIKVRRINVYKAGMVYDE